MEKFSKLIIDNRVYRVHGTKRKNIIESEYELKEPVKQLEKYIYDFILHNLGVWIFRDYKIILIYKILTISFIFGKRKRWIIGKKI